MWRGSSAGWRFLPFVRPSNPAAPRKCEYLTTSFIRPSLGPAFGRRSQPSSSNRHSRMVVSALRLSSSPSWEARMEMDYRLHRKRQNRHELPAVRREVQAGVGSLGNGLTAPHLSAAERRTLDCRIQRKDSHMPVRLASRSILPPSSRFWPMCL